MALSCVMKNLSAPVYRGAVSSSFSKKLIKPICSVFVVGQPYHCQFLSRKNSSQELFPSKFSWKQASLLSSVKQFSTSSARLAHVKNHDHSKLWTFERLLSAVLLPLVPAALIYPSQALDTALAVIIVLHTHFGLEAVVVDYVRPILFGEIIPKIGLGMLYLFSIITLAGLLNLIYNDAGLANTILNVWKH